MTYSVRKLMTGCLTDSTILISRADHTSRMKEGKCHSSDRGVAKMEMRMAYSKRKVMRGFLGGRKTIAEPASETMATVILDRIYSVTEL